jgi:hypothetical protein
MLTMGLSELIKSKRFSVMPSPILVTKELEGQPGIVGTIAAPELVWNE